jgi:hypothetical protein
MPALRGGSLSPEGAGFEPSSHRSTGLAPSSSIEPNRPHYAGIRRGAVELHLQFQSGKDFEAGTAGQAMLRLVADDPDVLFDEYKDKGVFHEGTQLSDTAWGTREFGFWDLNHNGLTFMCDL